MEIQLWHLLIYVVWTTYSLFKIRKAVKEFNGTYSVFSLSTFFTGMWAVLTIFIISMLLITGLEELWERCQKTINISWLFIKIFTF